MDGGDVLYFEYGREETEFLKSRDELLGAAIDRIEHIYRAVDNDLFLLSFIITSDNKSPLGRKRQSGKD
ncbi:hypothetical protein JTT01_06125 [Clostridium botulinum]|nr:hypothetical protein [Clostridium botulinum]MCS4463950.1 hypothetical protein [Clostridium botulinum]MCS4469706.1 hypothetical protein [Clostridium botulinum]MCS4477299.1 hypothetical protein [Clostridium botulinum]MCS4523147.1 hypothetical protein [Clostridium botulinum]